MRGVVLTVLGLVVGCGAVRSTSEPGAGSESGSASRSATETLRRLNAEAICHAEKRSDAVRIAGEDKIAQIQRWLERQLAHEELRAFALEALPTMTPARRAAVLAQMAEQGGIEPCPLAELWAWRAEGDADRPSCEEACELRQRATTLEERADCELGCRTEPGISPSKEQPAP